MPREYDLDEMERVYPNEGFLNLPDAQAYAILRDLRRLERLEAAVKGYRRDLLYHPDQAGFLGLSARIEAALAGEDGK